MKLYNYIAFSIYQIFHKTIKGDNHFTLIIKTSFILTLIFWVSLNILKGVFELKGYNDDIIPKIYIFILMLVLWLPNYLYLKREKFLNSEFSFNYKNVIHVLIVIFSVGSIFMFVVDKNRERIFKKRGYSQEVIDNGGVEPFDPNKKPESLEGDIMLWYYNTFEK